MPDNTALLPVGRLLWGSMYTPQLQTDDNNQPRLDSTGKQESKFVFAVAIPKIPGTPWNVTPWGQMIWNIGAAAYPGVINTPAFSWKIKDGDSTIPNTVGKRPCDQHGHPGNWIITMSQSWAPLLCDLKRQMLTQPDAIMPGDFVAVQVSVAANVMKPGARSHTPGVFINPLAVVFVGYHPDGRIVNTIDVNTINIESLVIPPNVAAAPVITTHKVNAPAPMQAQTAASMDPPPPPPAPHAAPPPAKQMTTAAAYTYEQYIASGWTDDALRLSGFMI